MNNEQRAEALAAAELTTLETVMGSCPRCAFLGVGEVRIPCLRLDVADAYADAAYEMGRATAEARATAAEARVVALWEALDRIAEYGHKMSASPTAWASAALRADDAAKGAP